MADIVVLDADCVKHLESQINRDRLQRSLAAAGFAVQPTLINLVEIAKNENSRVATRLYNIVGALAADVGLLPFPHEVSRETGLALLSGKPRYVPERTPPKVALDASGQIAETFRDAARQYTDPFDRGRSKHFQDYRPEIRRQMREKRLRVPSASVFLDRQWFRSDGPPASLSSVR